MSKIINKDNLKKILIIFLLLQPLLDTYILFEEDVVGIFGISPSTVIRLVFIFIMGIFSLFIIKSKRQWLSYILYGFLVVIYTVLHIYNATKFSSLTPGNFNFSLTTEIFYIIRLIIPLFIIVLTTNTKFEKEKLTKVFNTLIILTSGTIVVTNLLKISIGAYETKRIYYNIFDWIINNIHITNSFYDTATRGYFSFANMISSLLFGFTSILFYELFKEFNYKKVFLIVIQMLAMFMLGTKVSTFGFIISMITMFILYLFFLIKKEVKFDSRILVTIFLLGIWWIAIYPYSPCRSRDYIDDGIGIKKEETLEKVELVDYTEDLVGLTEYEKNEYLKEYVYNNYNNFAIKEEYIIDNYPYEYDSYFWYNMFSEPYYVKTNNRLLMENILNRLKYLNNRNTMDNIFGLTYSRTSNIAVLERDFVSQYYNLGIVGLVLFTFPYIIILLISGFKILFNKDKFNFKNITLLLCLFSGLAGSYFCGNTLDNLTFSIIYAFISGLLLRSIFINKEKVLKEDEITILALHLNYGGVEQYISSLCKMLDKKYKINIITTYKILDKPAFYFSDKINITYLINDKPNKEEFKIAIKNKNILSIINEGFKSIKILYLKRVRNIKAIKNIDSKYIITTRYFHSLLVGKYADKNIIKIATEHNYHNNDNKYIKKVVGSVKRFNYLILVSNNLKEFYKDKVKCKCVFIPNVIDKLPNKSTDLKENNIINIGRLEKEKGQSDLIDIVYELKKDIKDIKLYLIGDGSLKSSLEEKVKSLNLEDTVIFTGFISKEEIEKYMIKSKLFVMTSFTESFGIVLTEAMSYKVPCIAYDCADGARELLKNNNGVLIKDRNQKEMVNKIKKLLKDKKEMEKISNLGYNSCKKYLIENVKKEWLEILK